MNLIELLLIAIGLSMDAFAVSIGKGLTVSQLKPRHSLTVGLWFGLFQALMPMLGYLLAAKFSTLVAAFDHWIAFLLLALIGSNMIREACSDDPEKHTHDFAPRTMFILAVATSIDALSVGVTQASYNLAMELVSSLIIAAVTFVICMAGIFIGKKFGTHLAGKAAILGGIILIVIGIQIFLTGIL